MNKYLNINVYVANNKLINKLSMFIYQCLSELVRAEVLTK